MNNIIIVSFKAAITAALLFFIGERFDFEIVPLLGITFIITFIIALAMIITTIVPLKIYNNNVLFKDNRAFFKRFFPYYTVISALLCIALLLKDFESILLSILASGFITSQLTWLWLFKK